MSEQIPEYSKVRVTSSRFEKSDHVTAGTIGWVIERDFDDAGPRYEVEVMDDQGHTLALLVARSEDLEVVSG